MRDEDNMSDFGKLCWAVVGLFAVLLVGYFVVLPHVYCVKDERMAVWKKFDESVKNAAKDRYGHEGPAATSHQDLYARRYTDAIADRDAGLSACNCDTDRPVMDEEDIEKATLELKRLKERVLIKTALSYTLHERATDSTGTQHYWWISSAKGTIFNPVVSLMSTQGIQALNLSREDAITVIAKTGMWSLEEEFHPLMDFDGPQFLKALDALHYDGKNWDENGLSPAGEQYVNSICTTHGLSKETVSNALKVARR